MNFGERVKGLRTELGLSQEALGAQGFVSAPGWIKIENNQRQASEKLIDKLVQWLVAEKHMRTATATSLREELLVLKYLSSPSAFVRAMAKDRARKLPGGGSTLTAAEESGAYKAKPRRGRPPLVAAKRRKG